MRRRTLTVVVGLIGLAAHLAACRGGGTAETLLPSSAAPTASAAPSPTAAPTATEAPLAARVNGQPITLETWQREIARFEAGQAALGLDLSSLGDYRGQVLGALIDRELVLQAAAREGVQVAEAELAARYDEDVAAAGGQEAFDAWLAANRYTAEEYRGELLTGMTAQALAARVADVPPTAEQVRARHILVTVEGEANSLLAQLQSGADFGDLARRYSRDLSTRINGGALGWFPRGALSVPEVEDAAFNLQPDEISGIVHSALGFHLVQTLERDPARALNPGLLAARRQAAFDGWLAEQRAGALVEIPP